MSKHIEEILINGKPLSHYSGAVEKLTELAIKIHEEAIKELEGRKIEHDWEVEPSGSFRVCLLCGENTIYSNYCENNPYNSALDEATTYHKGEIKKLEG